jgi:CheY-like chemotaxis protein
VNEDNISPKSLLLADDDPHDLELTLAALDEIDLAGNVVVVHDGEEVLDYLYCRGTFHGRQGGNPAAVLLDNKMPKVTGLEVLKIVKADKDLKSIPIVVLTSSREAPDLNAFYEHGVNAYVVKPVDFFQFAKAIKLLGVFWTGVNEPPPFWRDHGIPAGGELPGGKDEVQDEIAT